MEKRPKNKNTHLFGDSIPYKRGLRIFPGKLSALLSPTLKQKLGRSSELFLRKGKKNPHVGMEGQGSIY